MTQKLRIVVVRHVCNLRNRKSCHRYNTVEIITRVFSVQLSLGSSACFLSLLSSSFVCSSGLPLCAILLCLADPRCHRERCALHLAIVAFARSVVIFNYGSRSITECPRLQCILVHFVHVRILQVYGSAIPETSGSFLWKKWYDMWMCACIVRWRARANVWCGVIHVLL